MRIVFRVKVLANLAIFLWMAVSGLSSQVSAQTSEQSSPTTSAATVLAAPPLASAPGQAGTATAAPPSTTTDDNYRLGSGDKLRITVYGEDDLSGDFFVDGSGQVQMPLIGQVKAAQLTIHEFVEEVTTKLGSGYLRNPKVSIEVENYRPFYTMGEVNKPGEYPFEMAINVLDAIALSGGYTYRANTDTVYIRRNGSSTEQTMPADVSTKVFPGDIIRVPERIF